MMIMIYYLHMHPEAVNKEVEKWFHTPMPIDYGNCGYYSDRIYNAHRSNRHFYISSFGYEKSHPGKIFTRKNDQFIIHFVFAGKGYFNKQPVKAGQMLFAPQNQRYTIEQDLNDPMIFSWIALSGTNLEGQIADLNLINPPAIVSDFPNAEEIKQIFLDTIYQPHDNLNMELFLFSKFYQVMALCDNSIFPGMNKKSKQIDFYYSKAISYINMHYAEDITVDKIAHHVHLSSSYLRKIFALKGNGDSPQKMVINKRMNVAKALLSQNELSIEKIALFIGFKDVMTFSKAFKKLYHIPPSLYRKNFITKKDSKNGSSC